jgi:hypothetical protein
MGTKKEVKERRQSVWIMASKGMHQKEMAEILNVYEATVSYDVKALQGNSDREMNELVRKMLPYMYEKSIMGINAILREAWNIYNNDDNPHITHWRRSAALKLAKDYNSNNDADTTFPEGDNEKERETLSTMYENCFMKS